MEAAATMLSLSAREAALSTPSHSRLTAKCQASGAGCFARARRVQRRLRQCQEESLSANNPRFTINGVAQVLRPSFLAIITRLVTHSILSI